MEKVEYKYPGSGAIEFARTFTESLSMDESLLVIKRLMQGQLHDLSDKRIKRCSYCGYFYRDKTRPNNSKTCSLECKIVRDTVERAKKRANDALLKPKKKSKRETYYYSWYEYPFWINEYEMLKQSWKYEVPHSPTKIIQIDAAKQRYEITGGRKKPKRVVPYNGDEKDTGKVSVKFTKSDHKPSEIEVTLMSRGEIESYFRSEYTERHLRLERERAIRFSRSKKV
ncbi:MAG: hypothetical protein AB2401_10345 [Bacillus sp. (in: firmicutes)]